MADAAAAVAAAARDGQTALALRLVKHLSPADADGTGCGQNVAFSPVSVHASLALVAAGAGGATLDQLLAFLGAPSAAGLAAFGRRVSDVVLADRSASGGSRVLFGGGLWVDASRGTLTKAFRGVAANSYKSEARTVSFTEPEETAAMINNWVKEATDNLIDTIISPCDIIAATDLVLANAVYFKGAWVNRFNSYWTRPDTFHRLDGTHVEAQFMWNTLPMHVSCMDGFKVLKLPYKRGQPLSLKSSSPDADDTEYSMFVFLPDERGGLSAMVDAITAAPEYLYSVLPKAEKRVVELKLPKFKIKFEWDLKSDLCKLGLSLPFSPEVADLRGMYEEDGDGRRPTFLSKVAHTAVVNVNEVGTEAFASSFILRGGGSPEDIVKFVADHPFTFFIMEEKSGVIVFAGHVLDPTE